MYYVIHIIRHASDVEPWSSCLPAPWRCPSAYPFLLSVEQHQHHEHNPSEPEDHGYPRDVKRHTTSS